MMVALDQIELTGEIHQQLMKAYVLMLIENKKPPPVKLIRRGEKSPKSGENSPSTGRYPYLVYDGNHRVAAARSIQRKFIKAELVLMPEGAE